MDNFLFWQLLGLLVVHYFGDFVFQSHWMASNKSKRNYALWLHVWAYSMTLFVWCLVVLALIHQRDYFAVCGFVLLNGAIHFAVDWVTSRHGARHFGPALQQTIALMRFQQNYPGADASHMRIADDDIRPNPGNHWHNFFLVIGYDQLLHGLTLGLTLWAFFG